MSWLVDTHVVRSRRMRLLDLLQFRKQALANWLHCLASYKTPEIKFRQDGSNESMAAEPAAATAARLVFHRVGVVLPLGSFGFTFSLQLQRDCSGAVVMTVSYILHVQSVEIADLYFSELGCLPITTSASSCQWESDCPLVYGKFKVRCIGDSLNCDYRERRRKNTWAWNPHVPMPMKRACFKRQT